MEVTKVRLRQKRGRGERIVEIDVPTDPAMEEVASELHRKGNWADLLLDGIHVRYTPSFPIHSLVTPVSPFVDEMGETWGLTNRALACCVFATGSDWRVSYTWRNGDDQPPARLGECGEIVSTVASSPPPAATSQHEQLPKVSLGDYAEGEPQQVLLSVHERSSAAREACIKHFGARCAVCGFGFEETYGLVGAGLIHVHHLKPLSEISKEYVVDPINDLRPVCPNCHAVIHRRTPPYTLDEVGALISK
jgi:hypothetical protein